MVVVELADMGESKDEEIELDLGLSIGGSFRNAEKSSNKMENLNESGLIPNGFDLDERKSRQVLENGDHQLQESAEFMDLQNKREIDQALRIREAKRKREQRRAPNFCNDRSMECVAETEIDESVCKKKVDRDDATNTYAKDVNLNLVSAETPESVNDNGGSNLMGYSSSAVTTAPPPYVVSPQTAGIAYGYGMVQYVPLNNGFGFPCAVPCRGPSKEEMQNIVQPVVACRGFRLFQNGSESGERDTKRHRKAKSNGSSSICSSPMVSDYRSSSHEGGGSSDGRSHSANSLPQPTHQLNNKKENKLKTQPEPSVSSNSMKLEYSNVHGSINVVKESQLHNLQPSAATTAKEETTENNAGSNDNEKMPPCPLKKTKSDMGKPPKPQSQTPALPQMPYVSTTGNGPNGKTVTGFLYRYTKSEVSIVCVCHGSTFSPAEFVQHAGGTDISHPLRHITVIPSAFG